MDKEEALDLLNEWINSQSSLIGLISKTVGLLYLIEVKLRNLKTYRKFLPSKKWESHYLSHYQVHKNLLVDLIVL